MRALTDQDEPIRGPHPLIHNIITAAIAAGENGVVAEVNTDFGEADEGKFRSHINVLARKQGYSSAIRKLTNGDLFVRLTPQ